MRLRPLIGAGAVVLTAALALACDEDDPTGPSVGTIILQPAADTLSVSETLQLEATVLDADGEPITGDVAFTSSASSIVSVSDTGLVTAVGPGEATVTAEAGGRTATATLFVRSAASIAVAPTDLTLAMDATQVLTVTVLDADDLPLPDPVVAFSSSDETVASVDADGVVTAVRVGSAVITVEVEGLTADVDVTVEGTAVGSVVVDPATLAIAVGDTSRVTATVQDSTGVEIPSATVTWTSQDALVATVDGTGLVTGVAVGATGVVAESGGVADTTSLTVQ